MNVTDTVYVIANYSVCALNMQLILTASLQNKYQLLTCRRTLTSAV